MEHPDSQSPLIIGHRGASAVAPENTLAAFALAFEQGADGIEFDVRLARDGIPVVIHDPSLRRTGGRQNLVAETDSIDLRKTDVGGWFNLSQPQFSRKEYSSESVPTLSDVFQLIQRPAIPRTVLYVELKTDGAENTSGPLAQSVIRTICDHELQKRVVVVSFDLQTLKIVKETCGSICTGALFEPRLIARRLMNSARMISAAISAGAAEILLHRLIATPHRVRFAVQNGLRPVVWTVDDGNYLKRKDLAGVHALITNNPSAMIAARQALENNPNTRERSTIATYRQ